MQSGKLQRRRAQEINSIVNAFSESVTFFNRYINSTGKKKDILIEMFLESYVNFVRKIVSWHMDGFPIIKPFIPRWLKWSLNTLMRQFHTEVGLAACLWLYFVTRQTFLDVGKGGCLFHLPGPLAIYIPPQGRPCGHHVQQLWRHHDWRSIPFLGASTFPVTRQPQFCSKSVYCR